MKFNLQNKLGAWMLSALVLLGTFSIPTAPLVIGGTSLAVLSTTSCTISASTIKADGAAVAAALNAIANFEALSNPTLAANLVTAANSLLAITSNWQTGSNIALFNDAANVVEIALAAIPQTALIAPLVPIAVAAIDILIANINPTPAPVAATLAYNPYRGQVQIHHRFGRSIEGDFKSAWNGTVDMYPALASARLK